MNHILEPLLDRPTARLGGAGWEAFATHLASSGHTHLERPHSVSLGKLHRVHFRRMLCVDFRTSQRVHFGQSCRVYLRVRTACTSGGLVACT